MSDEASLRRQLTKLRDKTASASGVAWGGWLVSDTAEDTAGKRRVHDDLAAGRLAYRGAHTAAKHGLTALAAGNLDLAMTWLTESLWLYIDALEKRLRPEDLKDLGQSAKRRGRKK